MRRGRIRLSPGRLSAGALRNAWSCLAALFGAHAATAGQLPIACVSGTCGTGPQAPQGWISLGAASAATIGNTLTVTQSTNQAILNWSAFNIDANGHVVFDQPGASAVALNRIFQASPSQIFGTLQANGQIYLINQNGFVFGPSAQVNVGGLLASTLNISDNTFKNGLLSAINSTQGNADYAAASSPYTSQVDLNGNPILGPDGKPLPVTIQIQPGATITTQAAGQRLMFAGQTVTNAGTLAAPDGQVVLAAGQSLFLAASTDSNLRGLVVEVDGGGAATNAVTGAIAADRGNVTLVGLAVNQLGRVSATTSVNENGSIYLLARDTVQVDPVSRQPIAERGGTLTLGASSLTTSLPDANDTSTAIDAQVQQLPVIKLDGQQVFLEGGSRIIAPDGQLSVSAESSPDRSALTVPTPPDPNAELRIDSGALIDLSGSTATVPVTRNLVTVQLRGSELADSPLQRDGPLRGQTVVVDARVGTPLANVSGELGLIQRGILERTDQGGNATFDSLGDIVFAPGATINVSGGQVNYTGGIMQTTQLVRADGSLVDIGQASANGSYTGILNPQFQSVSDRWGIIQFIPTPGIAHYEPGYVQGASAGSVTFLGSSLVLSGALLGHAVNGPYQRTGGLDPEGNPILATGGRLTIGAPGSPVDDFRAPAVTLVNEAPSLAISDTAPLPSDLAVSLPVDFLTSGGFMSAQIASTERITIPAGVSLSLPAGGALSLTAPQIVDDGNISAPGGTVSLLSVSPATGLFPVLTGPAYGVSLGDHAVIDVSGAWVNDAALPLTVRPTGAVYANAGSISLTQNVNDGVMQLGSGVELHASGGGWAQQSGSVTGGKGGSIAILAGSVGSLEIGGGTVIDGFGVNGAAGGSLSLLAPRLTIGSGDSTWLRAQSVSNDPSSESSLQVDASLFSSFGFASFALAADAPKLLTDLSQSIVSVLPGTDLTLAVPTLALGSAALTTPSGASTLQFGSPQLLLPYQRSPASLTLTAESVPTAFASAAQIDAETVGNLTFGSGARIVGDPGSQVGLAAYGSVLFDGQVSLPGGALSVTIPHAGNQLGQPYYPDQRIELGASAAIDVSGTVLYKPNDAGELTGTLLPGGTVTLTAIHGSVLADAGSSINFAGTSALLDLPTDTAAAPRRTRVGTAAGSLSIQAAESIVLDSALDGQAGVGDTGVAPGGSLTIALTRPQGDFVAGEGFPTAPRVLTLAPNDSSVLPGLVPDGQALIAVSRLTGTGIDALTLFADDRIDFMPGTQLTLARSFAANAPALGALDNGGATVSAPYIALGTAAGGLAQPANAAAPPTTLGSGSLTFSADTLALVGYLTFQGVSSAVLASSGDLALQGNGAPSGNAFEGLGGVSIAGDLTLQAARIWPTTGTSFSIVSAQGPENLVRILQSGASPGTPLSVGGALSISADDIEQSGTLLAPFGSISLSARNALNLNGGVISVSADGTTLPYGRVDNGTDWVYQTPAQLNPTPIAAVPQRSISLNSLNVSIAPGATIDVSGGGDLYGYEFTAGTGGTIDALAPGNSAGLYAVLPSLRGNSAAPYDPMLWNQAGLLPGESITLGGGSGLPAGTYLLLPARYGLLPGAYFVSRDPAFGNVAPGTIGAASDGAPVVAGRLTFANTGIGATLYSGYDVHVGGTASSSYGHLLADYTDNLASVFFATAASGQAGPAPPGALPADGGLLGITVQNSLEAFGTVMAAASGSSAEGAEIDLSAPALEIDPTVTTQTAGVVRVGADTLHSWAPGRLLLGGVLTGPETVQVGSDRVLVATGAAVSADEVILAARQSIVVEGGASITTPSLGGKAPDPARFAAQTPLTLQGQGAGGAAVLAVSDLADLGIVRPISTGGTPASVAIGAGASVGSRGAVVIDSLAGVSLADGALADAGAHVSLGAHHIVFGPFGSPDGLALDDALVQALDAASDVRLSSATSIDLQSPVQLGLLVNGSPTLSSVSFQAGALNNLDEGSSSVISAGKITLSGVASGVAPSSTTRTGSLQLNAQQIDLGGGVLDVAGFDQTALNATQAIIVTGTGQLSILPGAVATGAPAPAASLTLSAPVITANSATSLQLSVPNAVVLATPANASSSPALTAQPGGGLSVSAQTIEGSTTFQLPSGELTLAATQDLILSAGTVIDTAGITPTGAAHGSTGGLIRLSAGQDLQVAPGTRLDVSSGSGADAGTLTVNAGGTVDLGGTLAANDATGGRGGVFQASAGAFADFTGLNRALETGGFTQERDFEAVTGSLALSAGEQITAEHVQLLADAGSVTVAGTVNASAGSGDRGSIEIGGRDGVSIGSGAQLIASALDGGKGGTILLESSQGPVALAPGALIAATGAGGSGRLTLRVPVISGGTDVALNDQGVDGSHVDRIVIEPWLTFAVAATPASTDLDAINSAVQNQLAGITALSTHPLAQAANTTVSPLVDLRATGDLTLSNYDFSSMGQNWRFGPAQTPADIVFRAAGNLNVAGTLSDGFATPDNLAALPGYIDSLTDQSASLTLVAGANLTAISARAVGQGAYDLTLQPGAIVRTGTGDLTLAAARDVIIGSGASVYTGGTAPSAALTQVYSQSLGRTQLTEAQSDPEGGGSLRIAAGRDIVQANPGKGSVGDWQVRAVDNSTSDVTWGIDFAHFDFTAGALGGGDLVLSAGRNIANVSAATSDSRYVDINTLAPVIVGGGNLEVDAGGDVGTAVLYVASGTGRVTAGGGLTATRVSTANGTPIGSLLLGDDTRYLLTARGSIDLEGEFGASELQPLSAGNTTLPTPYYYRYGPDSLLQVSSSGGSVAVGAASESPGRVQDLLGAASPKSGVSGVPVYPASVDLASYGSDIDLLGSLALLPSTRGELSIYAARDVLGSQLGLRLLTTQTVVPSVDSPGNGSGAFIPRGALPVESHVGDTVPVEIAAGRDISSLNVVSPKPVEVSAGRDIVDVSLTVEMTDPQSISSMIAGRDVTYTLDPQGFQTAMNISGPGRFDVIAGRNVNLGFSAGITSYGNLLNPALPAGGADISVVAGLGAPLGIAAPSVAGAQDFLSEIVAPSTTYTAQLIAYVGQVTGAVGLSASEATTMLRGFPLTEQLPFAESVLFQELVAAGRLADTNPASDFARGYAAIDALFPGSRPAAGAANPYAGDLGMAYSRIYTLNGGAISILAPGGGVNVGLANPPSNLQAFGVARDPSGLGIATVQSGDVDIFAQNDVLVNESRVFTLGGGNIAIWSTLGNIDAGRGAKTAVSAPPPRITTDAAGNVHLDFSNLAQGSGIRTIQTDPSVPVASVDLIAPAGFVNAGDAGIGSSGNLTIAAQRVLGLDNIQVGGVSTGVPPEVSGLGAALSGASASGSSTANAATSTASESATQAAAAPLASSALSWIDVFIEGFGAEACKPTDLDCLKRQKAEKP